MAQRRTTSVATTFLALAGAALLSGCGDSTKAPPATPSVPEGEPTPPKPKKPEQATTDAGTATSDAGGGEGVKDALIAMDLRPRLAADAQLEHCLEEQQWLRENLEEAKKQDGRPPRIHAGSVEVGGPPWRAKMVGTRLCVGLPEQEGVSPHWDFALMLGALINRRWGKPLRECVAAALEAAPEAQGRFELRMVGDAGGRPVKVWVQRSEGVPKEISDCWVEIVGESGLMPAPTYLPFVSAVVPILLLPAGS